MTDEAQWLIWSIEHHGWWRPDSHGYTPYRKDAGRYSFDEACAIVSGANRAMKHEPNETMVRDDQTTTKD